ncbi:MAG TPA: hypothetical protein VJ728_08255, partial [Candidatus Binataceae bacterium]|nr:hypothetical protein [Candidatus Binataceae bacterium]
NKVSRIIMADHRNSGERRLNAFSPGDYLDLVQREAKCFELLTRLRQRGAKYPAVMEAEAINVMLQARNRQLRN